jgi:hypothetical protein
MIGVAVLAVTFGYVRPAIQMWQLAWEHYQEQNRPGPGSAESWHRFHVRRQWHARMAERYSRAAWLPWFPVEPEPLPP